MKDLRIHYSLLPAFDCPDPVKEAMLAGVKVTGVTVLSENRIVAQYPFFITNDMHYDELKIYLENIGEVMLKLVQEKLENNEVFEIQTLMNGNKCNGCHNCHNCGDN